MEDLHMQILNDKEEADSSSGEDESDSGSEEDAPKADVTVTASKNPVKDDSESGSETESGSDSEMEEEPSDTVVVAKSKESRARAAEETSSPVKRAKTVSNNNIGQESRKALLIQKVWSEKDVITLLESMIKFNDKEGNPYHNKSGFYDSVKECFSFSPNKTQLTKKLGTLKSKYQRKEETGAKDHDKEFMELAEQIWGSSGFADASGVKSIVKAKKIEKKYVKPVEEDDEEEEEEEEKDTLMRARDDPESSTVGLDYEWLETSSVVQYMVRHGLGKAYVKQKWSSAAMEDKKIIEGMCKVLHNKKVEWVQFETELMHEFTSRIFKST